MFPECINISKCYFNFITVIISLIMLKYNDIKIRLKRLTKFKMNAITDVLYDIF